MTRKILVALALVAAFGLTFGSVGDGLWTVSPYSTCADDGNPPLSASLAVLQRSIKPAAWRPASPTIVVGSPVPKQVRWPRPPVRRSTVCSPAEPPRRC